MVNGQRDDPLQDRGGVLVRLITFHCNTEHHEFIGCGARNNIAASPHRRADRSPDLAQGCLGRRAPEDLLVCGAEIDIKPHQCDRPSIPGRNGPVAAQYFQQMLTCAQSAGSFKGSCHRPCGSARLGPIEQSSLSIRKHQQ
jgi:hypothetical protein